ncbi:MAG: hypothetical protein HWE11_06340 [Gammaproteobacteria bacterium]|nr:hypothetical protein [Gammaproteobacteria bacterium]
MSYKIAFHKSDAFVELQWFGEVFIDELLKAFAEIVADHRYTPGRAFLIDYREATPMLQYQDLSTLANFAKQAPGNYRSAAVMKDDLDLTYANIWREYSVHVGKEEFACFTCYKDAVDWLESEPE